jgi:hypothetical protein
VKIKGPKLHAARGSPPVLHAAALVAAAQELPLAMCCDAHASADEELRLSELQIAEETQTLLELSNELAACGEAEAERMSNMEARLEALEEHLRDMEFLAEYRKQVCTFGLLISERLGLTWLQLYCAIRKEEYTHGPYCSAEADDSAATDISADAESEITVVFDTRYNSDHSDTEDYADETIELWPTATALERVLVAFGISWADWTSLVLLLDTPLEDCYGGDMTASEALCKLQSPEMRMPAKLAASKPALLKVLEDLRIEEAKRAVHYAKQKAKARRQRAKQRAHRRSQNSSTNGS